MATPSPWTDERDAQLRLTPRPSPIKMEKSVKPRAPKARFKAGRTLHFPAIRPAAQSRSSAGEPGAAAATALCFSSLNLPEVVAEPPRVSLGAEMLLAFM